MQKPRNRKRPSEGSEEQNLKKSAASFKKRPLPRHEKPHRPISEQHPKLATTASFQRSHGRTADDANGTALKNERVGGREEQTRVIEPARQHLNLNQALQYNEAE